MCCSALDSQGADLVSSAQFFSMSVKLFLHNQISQGAHLDIALHVVLYNDECRVAKQVKELDEPLCSF
jgi:hypothetical protein